MTLIINADKNPVEAKQKALSFLANNKIISCFSDTVYALLANPFDEKVTAKLNLLKNRASDKPLQILVSKKQIIRDIANISDLSERVIDKFMIGDLTIILPLKDEFIEKLKYCSNKSDDKKPTIAVRIPDNLFLNYLIDQFGGIIAATSANISGKDEAKTAKKILEYFGNQVPVIITSNINYISHAASTILDLSGDKAKIIRKGSKSDEIQHFLQKFA